MQANWSLIINLLLLIGVLVAIAHVIRAKEGRQPSPVAVKRTKPHPPLPESTACTDDIIAIRKVDTGKADRGPQQATPRLLNEVSQRASLPSSPTKTANSPDPTAPLMVFLLAKDKRQFAGYELLQTVLAAGLRFGEGQLFHRHQFANGQGPVLCSLAAATAAGVFDLPNIGAFSARGLCLFMHISQNPSIDAERFTILLDTARQLAEGLDAQLLDCEQKPLTEERIAHYYRRL